MKTYNACLEMTVLRNYTVEALGEAHAVTKATMLAEKEDDVIEVAGSTAEEAEPGTD